MKKKQVLDAALGSCKKWEGVAFRGEEIPWDKKSEPLCEMFFGDICAPSCPYSVVTHSEGCERGPFKESVHGNAIPMYLFLLAIYFELKDNWQGYLKSIKGLK